MIWSQNSKFLPIYASSKSKPVSFFTTSPNFNQNLFEPFWNDWTISFQENPPGFSEAEARNFDFLHEIFALCNVGSLKKFEFWEEPTNGDDEIISGFGLYATERSIVDLVIGNEGCYFMDRVHRSNNLHG